MLKFGTIGATCSRPYPPSFPLMRACRPHILILLVCTGPSVLAGAQPASIDSARLALDDGRVLDARRALLKVTDAGAGNAEAYYLLARSYLEAESPNVKRSRAASDRAIELDPDKPEYLAQRLHLGHFFPSSVLPVLRTRQKQDLAERILKLDDENEFAHFVLGEIALQDYLDARFSVSFPDLDNLNVPAPREAFFNAAYLLNPVLAGDFDSDRMEFRTSRRYASFRVEYVTKEKEARKRYELAVDHLRHALRRNPARKATYASLLTAMMLAGRFQQSDSVASTMRAALPHDPDAWMYSGLASFRLNRVHEADSAFERGIRLMGDELAHEYLNATRFSLENEERRPDGAPKSFWAGKDPFLLTPENERRIEHLARMVYAELRFGDMYKGRHGWETEPGDVIVRYGIPLAEAQTNTRLDSYLVFHYGDFQFKFMDLAKSGRLTFYSPKVEGTPDFEDIERAIDDDYTLVSRRIFRQIPERFVYDRHGTRVAIPYQVSVFRNRGGKLDVYTTLGIPLHGAAAESPVVSGTWLLDESGGVAAASTGSPLIGIDVAHAPDTFRVHTRRLEAAPGFYTLAVEFEREMPDEAGFQRRPLNLDSPGYTTSAISDLMLAYSVGDVAGPGVEREGYAIEPAPWSVFAGGQPIYVYFEAYDLAASAGEPATYRIEALLTPYKGKDDPLKAAGEAFGQRGRRGVSVSYEATAGDVVEPQYLILDTADTDPGTYLVALRLIDQGGSESLAGRIVVLE